jgi:hypothetical protein
MVADLMTLIYIKVYIHVNVYTRFNFHFYRDNYGTPDLNTLDHAVSKQKTRPHEVWFFHGGHGGEGSRLLLYTSIVVALLNYRSQLAQQFDHVTYLCHGELTRTLSHKKQKPRFTRQLMGLCSCHPTLFFRDFFVLCPLMRHIIKRSADMT